MPARPPGGTLGRVSTTPRALLRSPFELTWALAEVHLDPLTDDDAHFAPAELIWTVHRGPDDHWRPDWADTEPDPIPVPTIAWLTWHIDWWWSSALAHVRGREPAPRDQVHWAGSAAAAVARLRELHATWTEWLGTDEVDLETPSAYPWPAEAGLTVAHTAAWVNAELMKNVAEIGQLRLLRAARLACRP